MHRHCRTEKEADLKIKLVKYENGGKQIVNFKDKVKNTVLVFDGFQGGAGWEQTELNKKVKITNCSGLKISKGQGAREKGQKN